MEYRELGKSGIKVSVICLGTMTYGQQNSEKEAHEQLDLAVSQGINFIDTAELYPIPVKKETYGFTEQYIGNWLKKRKNRHQLIIASKIAGPRKDATHIRGGSEYTPAQIREALENSLKRLRTDYIDLYQLHWPERKANFFGKLGYKYDANDQWENNFYEILVTLDQLIKEGKIRHVGISNETPWGTMSYLSLAEKFDLPGMVSIQNPYNLINRTYEIGMAEISIREQVGLLAYSPLAFGLLSGKYHENTASDDSRLNQFPQLTRYDNPIARETIKKYIELARFYHLKPAHMALAYVNSRDFLTSTIIGATNMEQLKENIDSMKVTLSDDILEQIEKIHLAQPNPAP